MKAALVVPELTIDVPTNLDIIKTAQREAASHGAQLLLFPEATLTGLINNDNPIHDLPLGQPIPGPVTAEIGAISRDLGTWTALGLLERDDGALYDSAVLIDSEGAICAKYRRIQPQWHGPKADPSIYRQGSQVIRTITPFGSLSFLICGDLFDDDIVSRVRALSPYFVLFPFARCFRKSVDPKTEWDRVEKAQYLERVRLLGVTTLMVNYLAPPELNGGAFGGAFVVSADGTIIAECRAFLAQRRGEIRGKGKQIVYAAAVG